MKYILLLAFVCVALSFDMGSPQEKSWEAHLSGEKALSDIDMNLMYRDWLDHYGKDLTNQITLPTTFGVRFSNFKNKVQQIIAHNSDKTQGWTKGLNQFSDMTDEKFEDYYNLGAPQNCSATASEEILTSGPDNVPSAWDWRDQDRVTPVKDQGGCGSCWTFSTVGTLEAHYQIQKNLTGNNVTLSEQSLLDCCYGDDFQSYGCAGGLPSYAFNAIHQFGGIEANSTYPYEAKSPWESNRTCTQNQNNFAVEIEGEFNITAGNETQMKNHLYHFGPVAISYEVISDFRDYKNGTYSSPNCGTTNMDVNHAVVAVGYGTENGVDYWIVKNSWGKRWGNQGYFNIERNANMCAVAQCNSHPIGVKDYNPTI